MNAGFPAAAALLVLASAAIPQGRPELRPDDPVVRVTVNLVQVDAVVTDSHGRHVDDLSADDFDIYEDGKRQKITNFAFVKAPPVQAHPVESSLMPRGPLRAKDVRRTIVLIADNLGMEFEDIGLVRRAVRQFVDEQMQPGDLVAILTTAGGAGIFQQFTNDRRQLYASIDRIVKSPSLQAQQGQRDPVAKTLATNVPDSARGLISFRADAIAGSLVGTLNYAIQGLRELPGRKSVVLFSDGFPVTGHSRSLDLVRHTVELANRAAVVIYSIDSRGLRYFDTTVFFAHVAQYESNDILAQGTGGLSFHEYNGLAEEVKTSLDDMSSYYLIGYQPQRADFETVAGRLKFHDIKIKARRPGLHVRSRKGFSGVPDIPVITNFKTRHEQMRATLFSAFRAEDVPVQLSVFDSPASGVDPKTKRRPAVVNALMAIDPRGLNFEDAADGKKKLVLDVVAAAYGVDSRLVASNDNTFTIEVTPDELVRLLTSGLVYGLHIEIPDPGAYQIRAAVRDAGTERFGSATAFVQIPDFDRSDIALSSILLSDSDTARSKELSRQGIIGPGSAATRIFAPGAALNYSLTVSGRRIREAPAPHNLDVQVHLFHGPERIFAGQPIRVTGQAGVWVSVEGRIKLPLDLPAGEYAAELLVYDPAGKTNQEPRAQWVDFTIASLIESGAEDR